MQTKLWALHHLLYRWASSLLYFYRSCCRRPFDCDGLCWLSVHLRSVKFPSFSNKRKYFHFTSNDKLLINSMLFPAEKSFAVKNCSSVLWPFWWNGSRTKSSIARKETMEIVHEHVMAQTGFWNLILFYFSIMKRLKKISKAVVISELLEIFPKEIHFSCLSLTPKVWLSWFMLVYLMILRFKIKSFFSDYESKVFEKLNIWKLLSSFQIEIFKREIC